MTQPPQKGQLGHGDLAQRNVPTLVEGLKGHDVVAGAPTAGLLPGLSGHGLSAWRALQLRPARTTRSWSQPKARPLPSAATCR